jgi:hypothetical protein
MRAALCALLALPLAGCLAHRAEVSGAGMPATAGTAAVGGRVADGAPQESRHGPLPHEIPASWIVRGEDGRLLSAHAVLQSPLPWWQRFPADLLVDLWPGEVVVAAHAVLTPTPITPRSADDITAEARAHGYAP